MRYDWIEYGRNTTKTSGRNILKRGPTCVGPLGKCRTVEKYSHTKTRRQAVKKEQAIQRNKKKVVEKLYHGPNSYCMIASSAPKT